MRILTASLVGMVLLALAGVAALAGEKYRSVRGERAREAVAIQIDERCTVDANGIEVCIDSTDRVEISGRVERIDFAIMWKYADVKPFIKCWKHSDVDEECGVPEGLPHFPYSHPPLWEQSIVMQCAGELPEAGCGFKRCDVINGTVVSVVTHETSP